VRFHPGTSAGGVGDESEEDSLPQAERISASVNADVRTFGASAARYIGNLTRSLAGAGFRTDGADQALQIVYAARFLAHRREHAGRARGDRSGRIDDPVFQPNVARAVLAASRLDCDRKTGAQRADELRFLELVCHPTC
jgi:hypothetical protein